MKERRRLFKPGAMFYCEDTDSGKQVSLVTRHRTEAVRLIELKRQLFGNIGSCRGGVNRVGNAKKHETG